MSVAAMLPHPLRRDREKSPRASQPCVRCEAERQDLYVLPVPQRSPHGRSDVCAFCYLKITHTRPSPLSLVE